MQVFIFGGFLADFCLNERNQISGNTTEKIISFADTIICFKDT